MTLSARARFQAPTPPRSSRRRRLLAYLLTLCLLPLTGLALAAPASAEINEDIVVTGELSLPEGHEGQLTVGDEMTFTGTWDATDADPQPGDQFTIGLPPELAFQQNISFPLYGPEGQVMGECITDAAAGLVTCTLNDEVLNVDEVSGTFEFSVWAELATEEETVEFDFNGQPGDVELPGGEGIDDGVVIPEDWEKTGSMNSDLMSMTWQIDIPGALLASLESPVTIDEVLSDNHELCDPANLRLQSVRGSTVNDVPDVIEIVDADDATFAFELTAPEAGFDPNVVYRITYDTCTTSDEIDPQGTEYTNEATIVGVPGSSGVIGVIQDWEFEGEINKSGNVRGGADRNGVIDWTVTVSGDQLAGEDGFTLTESLGGPHELCTDGDGDFEIRGLSVEERYGPNRGQRWQWITGLLAADESIATDGGSFEVEFTIDDAEFEFKNEPYLYIIRYQTCSTTDGLPESGTVFENSASVDGVDTTGTATVPGRSQGKSGTINTGFVTLAGEEYSPQTTLGWGITIPGQELSELDSDLTLVDEITGTHQVCGVEEGFVGDVTENLGLTVEARDQINGGGLSTVTLDATATLDAEGAITIVVDYPQDLAAPGGGTVDGFSPEYQFFVGYTTCTTSGGMDAQGTSYGNDVSGSGVSFSQSVVQNNRASGTGTGVVRGNVSISKSMSDASAAGFPDDVEFTVHVREIAPNGEEETSYDLAVPLDGEPVSGLNSRGNGWTIELSEPTFPEVPGYTFGPPRFVPSDGLEVSEDGTTAIASLAPRSNIEVALENTAQFGSLEVVKLVEGPASGLAEERDLDYQITASIDVSEIAGDFPEQTDREFTLGSGADEAVVLEDLPIGSIVTFSETLPADDDQLTWSEATISPNPITVTPGHATEPATVTITNFVERTVGTFWLVKTVTGAEADNPAVPDEVTIDATWNEEGTPGEKTLTLPTDGTPVPFDEDLLIGTEVTLTERPLSDGSGIAWGAPNWSGTGVSIEDGEAVVTVGRDAEAQVTVENHAATSTAGLSLLKGITGEAAGEIDADTEFPVTLTWVDDDGVEQTRELTINATEPTDLGEDLPAGTEVTITEGERPGFDTVDWGSIVISGDDVTDNGDGSATVVVSDQQGDSTLITIQNEATWAPGTFSLAKEITGVLQGHPDVPETVTVEATWIDTDGEFQSTELVVPTDGSVVEFDGELPYQTEVTLTEVGLEDAESFTWATPAWDGEGVESLESGSAILTIGAGSTAELVLTNEAVTSTTSLELIKQLTGDGAGDLPSGTTFPVSVMWTDLLGEEQQLEVEVGAGEPTVISDIPLGVEITVVEGETDLPGDVRWEGVSWSADDEVTLVAGDDADAVITVSGDAGPSVSLELTNTLEQDEGGWLPTTGLSLATWQILLLLGLAAALIAAGAWTVRRHAGPTVASG